MKLLHHLAHIDTPTVLYIITINIFPDIDIVFDLEFCGILSITNCIKSRILHTKGLVH